MVLVVEEDVHTSPMSDICDSSIRDFHQGLIRFERTIEVVETIRHMYGGTTVYQPVVDGSDNLSMLGLVTFGCIWYVIVGIGCGHVGLVYRGESQSLHV